MSLSHSSEASAFLKSVPTFSAGWSKSRGSFSFARPVAAGKAARQLVRRERDAKQPPVHFLGSKLSLSPISSTSAISR